ncbi:MAG TPA: glycosyltransferase family 4 protein, partial [Methanoregula sp.]|nr:glycosyltransferase family 4 protein [Methanoregula sp.]
DVIYPFVKGGVEKRVWELAVRLTHRGHEVHLFGMKFWDGEDILIRDGVILHGVCPVQKLYAGGRRSIWQALYFSISLFSPLLKEKSDIIDCQQFPLFSCYSSWFVSRIRKTPLVITWYEVWGDYWFEYLGYKGLIGKLIERNIASFHCPAISVSLLTANRFRTVFKKPVNTVIPVGIDISRIQSVPPSTEKSDIIFVGRLIKEKHVYLLVRAFGILSPEQPELRLLVIGEGPEQGAIENIIHELSLEDRISCMGFQDDHDEIIARMKAAKVYVMPSTREGFGITALEALACGLPVVTAEHPANAIRDLITEKNGFICSLSPKDLADTILNALRRHTDMKNSCIASAALFDWERIASDVEMYYQSVIDTR